MKMYNRITLWVLIITVLYGAGFAGYKTYMGERVTLPYLRFEKTENGQTNFNWSSILLSVGLESQKLITDTIDFTHRVKYPIAPKFKIVEPDDKKTDTLIAYEIAQVVKDSMESIEYLLWGDIDGQSVAVRNWVQPSMIPFSEKPELFLDNTGTASPEAAINGFEKSIQPGNYEPQNKILASNRVSRTTNIVVKKLKESNIVPKKITSRALEIQLNTQQLQSALAGNRQVLDSLRYVDAHIHIVAQRLQITPICVPILLPFWMWLVGLLISLFSLGKSVTDDEESAEREEGFIVETEPEVATRNKKCCLLRQLRIWIWRAKKLIKQFVLFLIFVFVSLWIWLKKWWPKRWICRFFVLSFLIYTIAALYLLIGYLFLGLHFCYY